MSRSYKILVLLAWIEAGRATKAVTFPGAIAIGDLVQAVRRLASRSAVLRKDLGPAEESDVRLRRHLEENPIDAWTDGKGTGGVSYFDYGDGVFRTRSLLEFGKAEWGDAFRELVVELGEWRLAEYLGRSVPRAFRAKVSHSSGSPILFLPSRSHRPDLPVGWTPLRVDGREYEANFVKIAINVVRVSGRAGNELPEILRRMFGAEAGRPGRHDEVRFQPIAGGGWEMLGEPQRVG